MFEVAMERCARQVRDGDLLKIGLTSTQISHEEDTLLKEVVEHKIPPRVDRVEWIKHMKGRRGTGLIEGVSGEVLERARTKGRDLMWPRIRALDAGVTMEEMAGALGMA